VAETKDAEVLTNSRGFSPRGAGRIQGRQQFPA
jgi:hypothetical protein